MKYRQIFAKIWENIDNQDIILLNGARQVGKTSLLKMIEDKLVQDKHVSTSRIHWFDLENIEHLNIWANQISAQNLSFIKSTEKQYIFIDEFQKSRAIGSILKFLHDHYPNLKIIITGSASWYTSIDESMAGRKTVIPIWPLSFSEFMNWSEDRELLNAWEMAKKSILSTPATTIEKINNNLIPFLAYGGYPGVALLPSAEGKIKLLAELINSYLLRDLQLANYAADPLQAKKILTLLADQAGGLLDIQYLGLNSGATRPIIANRLSFLQNTFILHLLPPFFTNKTKELVKNSKVMMVDSGIYGILMQDFDLLPQTKQMGQLAENFAAVEILKRAAPTDQLFYWRTKSGQEVDLILKQGKHTTPIEVKSGNCDSVPSGLQSFIKLYHPETAYVLNWSVVKDITFQNSAVKFRPLWWSVMDKK